MTTPPRQPISPDVHRQLGIEANNLAWDLVGSDPASAVESAYAAAYHWRRATGYGPPNEARAAYLIAKAWTAAGEPALALAHADRCLSVCREHGLADFDLAYAHEARARALALLQDEKGSRQAWRAALAVPIADPEDKAIVDADFADARP